jgi:multidrug efflux pump subunit AcrA (membrane-fusion protein)
MWIVRLALRRPYTFVVMGLVIVLLGVFAIVTTRGALDQTSRTLLTEVRLRNEDLALMPGMYAQVKFSLVPAETVWVIPATALIARAAGPQIVNVRTDGSVHYVGVELGRDLGQSIEVVAGLTGSERLIVNPPDGLKEGARVSPLS